MKRSTRNVLSAGASMLLVMSSLVSVASAATVSGGGGSYPQSPPNTNAFIDITPPGYVNFSNNLLTEIIQDMGYPASALTGPVPTPNNAYSWIAKVVKGTVISQLVANYSIQPVFVNSKRVALTSAVDFNSKGYPSALGVTNASYYDVNASDLGGHSASNNIQSSEAWKWAEYLHGNPYFLFGNSSSASGSLGQGGFLYNDAPGTVSGYKDAYGLTNLTTSILNLGTFPDSWQVWDLSAIASGSGATVHTGGGISNLYCSDQAATDKTYTGLYTSSCAALNTANRADTTSGAFALGPLVASTTANDAVTSVVKTGNTLAVNFNQATSDTNHYYAAVLLQEAGTTKSLIINWLYTC